MVKNGLPDRWSDYQPLGARIPGTQIIAFKVPLKPDLCTRHLEDEKEWFTPDILLERQPNLKTVIDLTNTYRYYNPRVAFGSKGIEYVKIMVPGRGTLPDPLQMQRFFDAMDEHIKKYAEDKEALIGVHCTHGLNRTGYFICRYLVDRLKMSPDDAIDKFNAARGHPIERQHLIDNIKNKESAHVTPSIRQSYKPDTITYISPLSSAYEEDDSFNVGYYGSRKRKYGGETEAYNYGNSQYGPRKTNVDEVKKGRFDGDSFGSKNRFLEGEKGNKRHAGPGFDNIRYQPQGGSTRDGVKKSTFYNSNYESKKSRWGGEGGSSSGNKSYRPQGTSTKDDVKEITFDNSNFESRGSHGGDQDGSKLVTKSYKRRMRNIKRRGGGSGIIPSKSDLDKNWRAQNNPPPPGLDDFLPPSVDNPPPSPADK